MTDPLKLENQLCFPLYACAKGVVAKYKPLLDEIDLTYTQYITMMVLWEKKSVNVKELGESLFLDSGTLTPLLKKLAEKKLITRERSSEDERNLVVTITPKGEALRKGREDSGPDREMRRYPARRRDRAPWNSSSHDGETLTKCRAGPVTSSPDTGPRLPRR